MAERFPNDEQRRYLAELLRVARCPNARCCDGLITSTGPDPQHDPCEWCYQRDETIKALQESSAGTETERERIANFQASMDEEIDP